MLARQNIPGEQYRTCIYMLIDTLRRPEYGQGFPALAEGPTQCLHTGTTTSLGLLQYTVHVYQFRTQRDPSL